MRYHSTIHNLFRIVKFNIPIILLFSPSKTSSSGKENRIDTETPGSHDAAVK